MERLSNSPQPEYHYSPDHSARDELLHELAIHGWAERHSGSPRATTGLFALFNNYSDQLAEIHDAFSDHVGTPDDLAQGDTKILGHFILTVKQTSEATADVTVEEFPTEADAYEAYVDRDQDYLVWRAGGVS